MDRKTTSSPAGELGQPRVILHGGAGHITRHNLPPHVWARYRSALQNIECSTRALLHNHTSSALDGASHAVKLLEQNPLFNAGVGAVFTRSGTIELEASVMVSSGYVKRCAAVSLINHVKSPITLAAELLRRGECKGGDGAQGHVHLSSEGAERLARQWGLEMCNESYFWTKKRWQEHKKGLQEDCFLGPSEDEISPDGKTWVGGGDAWDEREYLPQGTVGCVVSKNGVLAVATSTGGMTNKLAGRIGDTPTAGAGYWADTYSCQSTRFPFSLPALGILHESFPFGLFPTHFLQCLPTADAPSRSVECSVAMSGTGNGDSFLRLCAVRTAAAWAQSDTSTRGSLERAVKFIAGPGGELQRSAQGRWGQPDREGEGGIIGIQLVDGISTIVFDFNCGGMFRCWSDNEGRQHCMVFRDDY